MIDLRENSEDFTDEEIAQAIPVTEMPVQMEVCPTCGGILQDTHHWQLRRRRPHLYNRYRVTCVDGHVILRVFRLDFMTEAYGEL